jgi:hypothetical protein
MSTFISLYDYLGHAAGISLGKQVSDYSISKNIPFKKRFISNPKYTGEVILYPLEFLEEYFKERLIDINTQLMEDSFDQNENEKIY